MKKLGLIINPIAGMGGSVGLKGTDGVLAEAVRRGAVPHAADKTLRALMVLSPLQGELTVLCAGGEMGGDALESAGLCHQAVYRPAGPACSAADTHAAARAIAAAGADIIAFAGGDGTARDICAAVGEGLPVLGIPAGVKIHSPVYAKSPEKAGELLRLFLSGQTSLTMEAEVLDIDESDYRLGIISTRLYGYLTIPHERRFMQGGKAPSPLSEKSQQLAIAASLAEDMADDSCHIVGPGSTTRSLMDYLQTENTLLGVDLLWQKKAVATDVSEREILACIDKKPAKLIVTPTGGQGYLLGRGNQQVSPRVIKMLGKQNIIVAATPSKLAGLYGRPLLVDTGDKDADALLRGYVRVSTGYREAVMYPVE
ncbi:MAG: ATP-NAD kinase family protein [Clostridiales bacterium]|nr:ATP-NAD kinase family protein [Clostridiales bacterium]